MRVRCKGGIIQARLVRSVYSHLESHDYKPKNTRGRRLSRINSNTVPARRILVSAVRGKTQFCRAPICRKHRPTERSISHGGGVPFQFRQFECGPKEYPVSSYASAESPTRLGMDPNVNHFALGSINWQLARRHRGGEQESAGPGGCGLGLPLVPRPPARIPRHYEWPSESAR